MQRVLLDVRENVEQYHRKWLKRLNSFVAKLMITPCNSTELYKTNPKETNVPATTPEDYHKRALTIPFLDHMTSHIETRFSNLHKKAVMALKIIPSAALQSSEIQGNDAHELVNFFINDLPSAYNVERK